MKWATRRHCHVDRAACAWLIRRFVDMRGVELGHRAQVALLRHHEADAPRVRGQFAHDDIHLVGHAKAIAAKGPGRGQKDECLTQLLVIPGKPSILSHSVFGTKVTYNVEVSLATDVDAANIGINVTATKP
jgi:hypothetical protein